VSEGENVAIVADSRQDPAIVEAFVTAARTLDVDTTCVVYSARDNDQEEPPIVTSAAMAAADAYILIPTRSIVYTTAQARAREAGARLLVCTGMTLPTLTDVVPHIDYKEVNELGDRLMRVLDTASEVRITSPIGTDLRLMVKDRPHFVHDGVAALPGEEDDIPGGGAFVIPVETQTEGTFAFNASLIPPVGLITTPIVLEVERGRITSVKGGREAAAFEDWLDSFAEPNMSYVSELGFGLNKACYLTGHTPGQDESIYGMVHLGVGRNLAFPGGSVDASSHTDGMLAGATVWFDDAVVIRDGEIV
jgi:leucyl aminopeptidase (aminopeptidase T)